MKDGKGKTRQISTWDVSILYGEPYRRLVASNDRPLDPREEKKQQAKLAKVTFTREHETGQQRRTRLAELEKKRAKAREFMAEVPDAFDFKILKDDQVDGRDAWAIQAEPKPGFKGAHEFSWLLPKIHGTVWIDKTEYQWVKANLETIDTVTLGGGLMRLGDGAIIEYEQTRVNDEPWLPRTQHIQLSARVGLVLKGSADIHWTYSNYRKFQTDTRIVSTGEVEKK